MTLIIVTLTSGGMIKCVPLSAYRHARRGGKGRTGLGDSGENCARQMVVAEANAELLFLTSLGGA